MKNYLCKALLLPLTNVAYNLWQKLSQVKWCMNDIFWSQIHFRCKIIMDKISICSFYCKLILGFELFHDCQQQPVADTNQYNNSYYWSYSPLTGRITPSVSLLYMMFSPLISLLAQERVRRRRRIVVQLCTKEQTTHTAWKWRHLEVRICLELWRYDNYVWMVFCFKKKITN